uniref:Uncharacterized protein n=1 Tax=Meloidogyne hapla TaxID=6305 RepID=A0A1I8C1I2_MELHA
MLERMNNDEILHENLKKGESIILTELEIEKAKMSAKIFFEIVETFEDFEDLILLGGELAFAIFVGNRLKSGENLIKNFEKIIEVKPIILTPKSGLWYILREAVWRLCPILLALDKNYLEGEKEILEVEGLEDVLKEFNEANGSIKSENFNYEVQKNLIISQMHATINLLNKEKYRNVLLKNNEMTEKIKKELNEGFECK